MKLFNKLFPRSTNERFLFFGIIAASAIVVAYKINTLMPFIGDQGWYYLSAYRLLTGVEFPLVGIASSHPWLHQGAFWTYLLAPALWIGKLHVLSGFYLSLIFFIATLVAFFKISEIMFSKRIAYRALALYAFSPFIILQARVPYHTTPIPFFTLLYIYSLYLMTKKSKVGLPLAVFFLSVLYNFEIASAMLFIPLVGLLGIGWIKKEQWIAQLLNIRTLLYALSSGIAPLIPFLLYDTSHGFPQTLKFVAWVGYRILLVFGYTPIGGQSEPFSLEMYLFREGIHLQQLLFMPSTLVAAVLFFGCITVFLISFIRKQLYKKVSYRILALWSGSAIGGYVAMKTSSDAYLPLFLLAIILIIAVTLDSFGKKKLTVLIIGIICTVNIITLLKTNYTIGRYMGAGVSLQQRQDAVKSILQSNNTASYTLIGSGEGSKFASFTMNYEYLGIMYGRRPQSSGTIYHISESFDKVTVVQEKKHD